MKSLDGEHYRVGGIYRGMMPTRNWFHLPYTESWPVRLEKLDACKQAAPQQTG
jgi:hypothetical protein